MYTQGFGEVLADILTINPAIGDIPSASAILDTSNFTFNAITYGKDAHGFKFHGHTLSSGPVGGLYNDGYLLVKRYNTTASSYHTSSTHLEFSSTYSSIPNYPSIYDTRLERASTLTNVSDVSPDLGHYTNAAIDAALSGLWNVIGGFPPGTNDGKYKLLDSDGNFVISGTLSGPYNENKLVDASGFVKIHDNPAFSSLSVENLSGGPNLVSSVFLTPGRLTITIVPQLGDAAALAAFGGVNHIGVYCLDLKSMLAGGLTPPYAWDSLNNIRKYKLVAKVTFWDNLLIHEDNVVVATVNSGLENVLNLNTEIDTAAAYTTYQGPLFTLDFQFV